MSPIAGTTEASGATQPAQLGSKSGAEIMVSLSYNELNNAKLCNMFLALRSLSDEKLFYVLMKRILNIENTYIDYNKQILNIFRSGQNASAKSTRKRDCNTKCIKAMTLIVF